MNKYRFYVEQHEIYSDFIEIDADSEEEARKQLESSLQEEPLEIRKDTYEDTETTIKLKEIDGKQFQSDRATSGVPT